MKYSRFYQESRLQVGQEIALSPEVHRHAIQVLRFKEGQSLILFNGQQGEYLATLIQVDKRKSTVLIESFEAIDRESPLKITLFLAMIKPDKMDFAIQKAVELGVTDIQPVYTQRSVIHIKTSRLMKKMHHWQGIIIAACEQSGRTKIPALYEPKLLADSLQDCSASFCLTMSIGDHPRLADVDGCDPCESVALFVGPEGGFTDEEETQMSKAGIRPITFGRRVLRAETAVIAGLTACQQKWGDI